MHLLSSIYFVTNSEFGEICLTFIFVSVMLVLHSRTVYQVFIMWILIVQVLLYVDKWNVIKTSIVCL